MNTKSELSLQDFHGAPAAPSRCSRLVIAAQQPSIPAVDSLSTATLAPLIWLSLSHLPASLPLAENPRWLPFACGAVRYKRSRGGWEQHTRAVTAAQSTTAYDSLILPINREFSYKYHKTLSQDARISNLQHGEPPCPSRRRPKCGPEAPGCGPHGHPVRQAPDASTLAKW